MKFPNRSLHPIWFIAVAAGVWLSAEQNTPPPPSHVLFMGADLMLQHEKKLYRVQDVTGSEFSIRIGGREVLVPTRQSPVNLHIDADLKLSGISVQLDDFKAGPGYTYGNDPMRQIEQANRNNMQAVDARDTAVARAGLSEKNLAAVEEMTSHWADRGRAEREIVAAQVLVQKSDRAFDYSTIASNSESASGSAGAHRMALAEGNYDAMEVSFKVSSPTELNQAYMVVLFKFHDPAAKPGVDGLAIHAQALDLIDAKPRYVRVLHGGLPLGFKFVDCTIHIYNRGKEFATNLSDSRAEMTREQTQLYLVSNHRRAHKGATLPAAAVPGMLPISQRERLKPTQLTKTFYAKIASDGVLLGAFKDQECQVPFDDDVLKTALGEIFFTPALEAGKPVEGVASIRLADL